MVWVCFEQTSSKSAYSLHTLSPSLSKVRMIFWIASFRKSQKLSDAGSPVLTPERCGPLRHSSTIQQALCSKNVHTKLHITTRWSPKYSTTFTYVLYLKNLKKKQLNTTPQQAVQSNYYLNCSY